MKNISNKKSKFIEKANLIHNNKYDYSQVIYKGAFSKVKIVCLKHGPFQQTPRAHLNGRNCKKCVTEQMTMSKDYFVQRANLKHNSKFDYSQTQYINYHSKIKIFCPIHGLFEQTPAKHLESNHGCPKCGIQFSLDYSTKIITVESFIKEANEIHNNKYDYSLINEIKDRKSEINIICPKHGPFKQKVYKHLSAAGCRSCAGGHNKLTQDQVIEKFKLIHNDRYDYSLVEYVNAVTLVKIICHKHGIFEQKPIRHMNNANCPKCSNNVSNQEIDWLNYLNIPEEFRQKILKINNKYLRVDAYIKETNTIYEYYGDYWHGNPNVYNPNDLNERNKKTFGELYTLTLNKEKIIKEAGYNLVTIWEDEFSKIVI